MAVEHRGADIVHDAELAHRNGAIGEGNWEFRQEAVNFCNGRSAGGRGEFAGEIGRAKPAVLGVRMGVAEAVGLGIGGEGAAASVGEGESAAREVESVGSFVSHRRSIAGVTCTHK